MRIAVASGKGGVGKTTTAVALAQTAVASGSSSVALLDCDVEAPDAALSLNPHITESRWARSLVPEIDADQCSLCGRCAEVCAFHALATTREGVLVFPELCHGCGSCVWNCPDGAIHETWRRTGVLERGHAGSLVFARGTLDVGQAMATPVIRQLQEWILDGPNPSSLAILDAPPGSACPVVETLRGCDYVVAVTEPTAFGLHDLQKLVEVAQDALGTPVGVVVNREQAPFPALDRYCESRRIPILLRIPFEFELARELSCGKPLLSVRPQLMPRFGDMLDAIGAEVVA